jgi:putative spermidine/putrescine transport system permease protein
MIQRALIAGHPLRQRIVRLTLGGYTLLIALFLLAPIVAITAGSLTETSYVVFPPQGLTLKWYIAALAETDFLTAMGLSLLVAIGAASVATVFGLVVAIALHRYPNRLNVLIRFVVLTPIMLPSVFLGLALLIAYSEWGLASTPWGLFAGHVVLVTPFTVSLSRIGLDAVDPGLDRAARSLGATPFGVLRHVTLALISWSLIAGWGFAFMISFGSLEISLFLTTPTMVTLPVKIYSALEWSPLDPSLTAFSSGLVIVSLIVLLLMARFLRLDRLLMRR